MTKALFFCARRPPAFVFTTKERCLSRNLTCCNKSRVLLCAAASGGFCSPIFVCLRRNLTVCDKSPVLLCAASSGVCFHYKRALFEQEPNLLQQKPCSSMRGSLRRFLFTHFVCLRRNLTVCDKSPVLLRAASSGVFFSHKTYIVV